MSVDVICGIQCDSTATVNSNDGDHYHMFVHLARCKASAFKQVRSACTKLPCYEDSRCFAVSGRDSTRA